jgi:hypothetical protein
MPVVGAPLSLGSEIIDRDIKGQLTGSPSSYFMTYLRSLSAQVSSAPIAMLNPVSLVSQNAAIVTTRAHTVESAGLYLVSYYARITTVAGVASSLTVTLGWMESGIALSQAFAAMVGNVVTDVQNGVILVRADAATDITFEAAYASNPANAMNFRIDVIVWRVY